MIENNMLIQVGGILATLLVTALGIFKGLIPKLLESFETRLSDKDAVLTQQKEALDEVCRERRDLTDHFLQSLNNVVIQNSTSMTSLSNAIENFQKKMVDDHAIQHENHTELLDLLRNEKKPKTRRKTARKAAGGK